MRILRTALALILCLLFLFLLAPTDAQRERGGFLHLSRRVTACLLEWDGARAVFGIERGEESFV